jgi:hypothetical protein
MLKQLTLFCTFAIFMLAAGGAVTPAWAHAECGEGGKGKHSEGHPHCVDGSTDDGSLYRVWVDGVCADVWNEESLSCSGDWLAGACQNGSPAAVFYGVPVCPVTVVWEPYDLGIPPYFGHDPVGHAEEVVVGFQHIDMDLSYFIGVVDNGSKCFAQAPVVGGQTTLSIALDDDGRMSAWYFFTGYSIDGKTEAGYLLKMWTSDEDPFTSPWRPVDIDDPTFTAVFSQWEFGGSSGKGKKRIRCKGSGASADNPSIETPISIKKIR